jgi:hypothetical protein
VVEEVAAAVVTSTVLLEVLVPYWVVELEEGMELTAVEEEAELEEPVLKMGEDVVFLARLALPKVCVNQGVAAASSQSEVAVLSWMPKTLAAEHRYVFS